MTVLNVLLLSAGVTTGWHLAQVARQYFAGDITLHLADINPREFVPAATLTEPYHRVPPLADPGYEAAICKVLEENHIDVIIPLIDQDLFQWAADAPVLTARGVRSTAPLRHTAQLLSDKEQMFRFLQAHGLPTPALVAPDATEPGRLYLTKKKIGCGSHGMRSVTGGQPVTLAPDEILQEQCDGDGREVTAEIFNAQGKLRVFCRERVATKAGVCTKMVPFHLPEIEEYIAELVRLMPCPTAFCAQFMQHRGRWNLIDCNLRMGAGTALATAAGFQLVRAFWADLCGKPVPDEWLQVDPTVKSVLRVYEEVVVR
ncbi:ATP-grasp domain-containing protein [Subdoligranulum variabile]|uniref:ATP-grasp domain-containing protein n=1 Tax=Subdoligranulum variabile TaxID=214851 RepID=UPI0026E9CE5C|nr:ATP-grasp domain-containing protein [Subdoligranulum variabile]